MPAVWVSPDQAALLVAVRRAPTAMARLATAMLEVVLAATLDVVGDEATANSGDGCWHLVLRPLLLGALLLDSPGARAPDCATSVSIASQRVPTYARVAARRLPVL